MWRPDLDRVPARGARHRRAVRRRGAGVRRPVDRGADGPVPRVDAPDRGDRHPPPHHPERDHLPGVGRLRRLPRHRSDRRGSRGPGPGRHRPPDVRGSAATDRDHRAAGDGDRRREARRVDRPRTGIVGPALRGGGCRCRDPAGRDRVGRRAADRARPEAGDPVRSLPRSRSRGSTSM